ncbi:MAG: dihydroxyacetone kinase subunit DhaK [Aestuariivita sp.]|nr:dihydroxyacetone kinase subunit DhaK [Aestuariivita sp.]MCY4201160.1 dihydroxyacetone kinase subunit DhaK [Aestuariivita sp.]
MTQFINSKATIVTEAINGLLGSSGGLLTRLDGYPHIKFVYRTDWDRSKVALISGGGSGHEPAHAGFVGTGMLTGAVCGEVFASPSVEAVLAGIVAVTGDAGCLLIVKNYTGDRLNFGLAAERARALGYRVKMVVVADDIAIPDFAQPRGLAGTLFAHKIAGSYAENGADLDAVTRITESALSKIVSIGMSLNTCTLPGQEREDRIPAGKAELGLGIHGEPGAEQIKFRSAKDAVATMIDRLRCRLASDQGVALINNLGAATGLEMAILTNALVESNIAHHIIGPAPMMTSLDMHGFSISILPTNPEELAALAAEVQVTAWPKMQSVTETKPAPLPDGLSPPKFSASSSPWVKQLIQQACSTIIVAEAKLNDLDAKSGDGDTGTTLATAARALSESVDGLPLAVTAELLMEIGNALHQSMGGSLGAILAVFFAAAGDASRSGATPNVAFDEGLQRICEVGGAKLGDRTIIDALLPALQSLPTGMRAAAMAAREGADTTAQIHRAKVGRAAYVPKENLIGNNDPGAEAVALVFSAFIQT